MGILTYLVYPIRSVAKNRMRSLYAMIGIILAISFFTGSFIAIDSSSNAMVRASLVQTPVDFECFATPIGYKVSGFERGAATLESVDNVVEASPVIDYSSWGINKPNSTVDFSQFNYYQVGSLMFIDQNSTMLLERFRINGSVPEAGTVAISEYMATSLGIGLNEEINISRIQANGEYINGTYVGNDTYLNLTYRVSQIWTQEYTIYAENGSETFQSRNIHLVGYYSDPVVFNLVDADGLIAKATQSQGSSGYQGELTTRYAVFIDRDKVISAGDIGGTLARLNFIKNRLGYKGTAFGVYEVQSNLANVIEYISSDMASKKELFLALSLPVMMLGTYLSMVGIDLATFDRRREIGIIKARGGTKRQVLGEMIVESTLLGTGSAIIGLLGGILISRFLMGVSTTFLGAPTSAAYLGDISLDSGTLATAIFFGIILMIISSYRPISRLIKIETSEALHIFTPVDARKEYNPKWDFAALALSAACVFGVVATSEKWIHENSNSFVVTILIAALGIMGIALLPLLPILLSMSTIRLLTRGPRKLYTKFAAVMRPWTKEVQPLVEVNIERNPKRSSMICMVIALAVAFGLFVSVTMESTLAYEIDKVRYQIGADIGGQASWHYSNSDYSGKQVNLSKLDAIDSLQGVRSICRWTTVAGTYGTNSLSLFDPDAYFDTVRPADFWFDGEANSTLSGLKRNGTALIPQSMADLRSILVGDTLPVRLEFHRENATDLTVNLNLEIIGIIKGLPGLSDISYYPGYIDYNLYAGRDTLASIPDQLLINSTSGVTIGILVAINQGSNHVAITIDANDAYVDAGLNNAMVRDATFEVELKKSDPYVGALTQFLNTEYASSMGIMTVGVAMIIFVTVSERRQEIACIMARGSSSKQMTKMLMGESITLMMLGLVIGTAVGLLTAYLYNYMTAALSNQVGHSLVLTYVSLSILLVAVIAMLVVSFLTTVRAGKIKLAEVLRIRGG